MAKMRIFFLGGGGGL